MTDQIMVEGNAVIGELEMFNIQLKDDYDALNRRYEEEREWTRTLRAIIKRDNAREVNIELEKIVRDMLDEIEYDDDTEHTRELRKMLWNDSDTDKQMEAEGFDRDEEANTSAWYEMNVGE